MKTLMCLSCGHFVTARPADNRPISDECPECGGTEFKDTESDERIRTS